MRRTTEGSACNRPTIEKKGRRNQLLCEPKRTPPGTHGFRKATRLPAKGPKLCRMIALNTFKGFYDLDQLFMLGHEDLKSTQIYTHGRDLDPVAGPCRNPSGGATRRRRQTVIEDCRSRGGCVVLPDLGLYYLRARSMNPLTSRFMSRDPEDGETIDPKTLHKYLYAGRSCE